MHRNVTHNRCYATLAQFADATLGFLRENVPQNWPTMYDSMYTIQFKLRKIGALTRVTPPPSSSATEQHDHASKSNPSRKSYRSYTQSDNVG